MLSSLNMQHIDNTTHLSQGRSTHAPACVLACDTVRSAPPPALVLSQASVGHPLPLLVLVLMTRVVFASMMRVRIELVCALLRAQVGADRVERVRAKRRGEHQWMGVEGGALV